MCKQKETRCTNIYLDQNDTVSTEGIFYFVYKAFTVYIYPVPYFQYYENKFRGNDVILYKKMI